MLVFKTEVCFDKLVEFHFVESTQKFYKKKFIRALKDPMLDDFSIQKSV